jgi:Winged helix-turn-helix domain (DUF2582)
MARKPSGNYFCSGSVRRRGGGMTIGSGLSYRAKISLSMFENRDENAKLSAGRCMMISEVETIGETAGLVWQFLRSNGESSLSALEKGVKAPRSTVSMAVGWLAREGKIQMKDEKRTVRICLRDA